MMSDTSIVQIYSLRVKQCFASTGKKRCHCSDRRQTGSNPGATRRIGSGKSASGYQFLRLSSRRRIRLQDDVIINRIMKTLLAPRGIVPSSESKRGRAGTESDLVPLLPDDSIAHTFFSNRAAPPMADHSFSHLLSRLPR